MLVSTNPHNEECVNSYATFNKAEIDNALNAANRQFTSWKNTSYEQRAQTLKAVAAALRNDKENLAHLMAVEMGKPLKEGLGEVEKAAWCAEHYADNAKTYLQSEDIESDAIESYVCYQPLGCILGILPWNAPIWLAFRFLAPSLMAGNTCIMKHDPSVQGCANAIMHAFKSAMAPDNIVTNLPIDNAEITNIIKDRRIAGVSFTGSSATGAKVAADAGSVLIPYVLELGGSDPCVVLADAELEKAADIACLSRIINAGQSCIAAKRIIVEESIYDQFITLLKDRLERLKVGDPLDNATQVGPLARKDIQQNLHRQVKESIEQGANCLLGGTIPDNQKGYYYPVTLLTDVTPSMTVFNEETFGPVMCVTKAKDINTALNLANQTVYGLGAAIWTKNLEHQQRFMQELQAGQVAVNGIVKTDPRLPSGGIKSSGIGRELGPHGIREFVNCKQIWVG
ncbi:succinate-semialdehyde dehydrogenase [Catenovulum agarivorans DS-2]|uniref:Succinate-semialdehyde dehydrogenase n=1 Tax=Catenovulum agarivorans DS-2 TaxID=1328313 RepID=W7QWH9_9ALTE|nr:NAD-dependent succinate-semialdehyde dehydrogenase [Catenovulum agarivorans]EWH12088.1 succinate-semialdehyde dehydrogenase [Catenovulum agarivorans DS-2]